MPAHLNRGGTQAAPTLPDDPIIDLLAQTNAKVEDFDISPDGTQVCYVSAESGGFDVWSVNLDGTDNRRIVSMYPEQALHPVWSPDGQWVAYAARGDVFKVRADGSEPPINLSHGLGQAPLQEYIQWTPDGKNLVLVRSTRRLVHWHRNSSWRLARSAPGRRPDSHSTWNPLQMPITVPPESAKACTESITGEKRAMAPGRR